MFTTLTAVIFFSLKKKRDPPKDTTYETLLSACYRWAIAWEAGNSPRISVPQQRLSSCMTPVLSLQRFSPPSIFLCLHCELWKAPCKTGVLPSQPSIKRGTEMDALQVCYSLRMSFAESHPLLWAQELIASSMSWVKSMVQLCFKPTLCVLKDIRE